MRHAHVIGRRLVQRLVVPGLLAIVACSSTGCYYAQALHGHMQVMGKREPVQAIIADPDTSDALRRQLQLVQEARDFSVRELGLPDNDSYRTYADVERDYVVWNVFAAPEFSLDLEHWCYLVVGCVSYRGYYEQAQARHHADRLADKGFDVYVGGVAAYSTLGNFDDPVLNTMMRWDDEQLVAVIFHELAHQVLYIRNDSAFNESFATAVEEFGIERFLAGREAGQQLARYRERNALRQRVRELLDSARRDLATFYAETLDDDEKRLLKEHRLETLAEELRNTYAAAGREIGSRAGASSLNNARLASIGLYEARLPAFRRMFGDCGEQFTCFYAEAKRVGRLAREERNAYLDELATR